MNSVEIPCDSCGTRLEISKQRLRASKSGKFFCNRSCSMKWKHSMKKIDFKKISRCPFCQKNVSYDDKMDIPHKEYCDQNPERKKLAQVKCSLCQKEFLITEKRRQRNKTQRFFCEDTCYRKFNKEKIPCPFCGLLKYNRHNMQVKHIPYCKLNPDTKCSKFNCSVCGKEIWAKPCYAAIINSEERTNRVFCSRACHIRYARKNGWHKKGGQRSRYEILLENIIKETFPGLTVLCNDREILAGLEIDIFIPELSLGIEYNGPRHYLPWHGEEHLRKTQQRDSAKNKRAKQKRIHLITLPGLNPKKEFEDQKKKVLELIERAQKSRSEG